MAILGLKGKVLDAYDGILTIKNKKYDPKENDKKFIGIVYENGDGEILFFHLFILLNTVIAMSKYWKNKDLHLLR